MRNIKITRLFALLAVLAALTSLAACHANASTQAQAEIQTLFNARESGVDQADQQEYLTTVLPGDKVLMKEESNLIRASAGLGIKDFKLTGGTVKKQDDGSFTAAVKQTYTLAGEARECTYTALFKEENGKLYYDGPDFSILQSAGAKVYYVKGKEDSLAKQLLDEETATLSAMQQQLNFTPQEAVSIKLFDDRQVFLQSVKLDLPAWVGGWHEYGEAVKSYTGAYGNDGEEYKSMLNHETTHLMVSELSNDNASYWMQEGMAGIYQNALGNPGAPLLTQNEILLDYTPYTEQKKIDLEKLGVDDQDAVLKYYASSKAYMAFLVEQYGWGNVRSMLEYMKKFELIPVTADEKIAKTNDRTDEAIANVIGLKTDADFQAAFDKWLNAKKSS